MSSSWQKSSHSAANDNCIEVRAANRLIEIRESDDGAVIVRTGRSEFAALLQGVKGGAFDLSE
ncbi:DUF397 domain-containing protein [Kitasatospora sp. NPDC093806]|uniref:DUF397 domain-containing protein n=1 Tax=Kitasatospora sp. NPDC093806 TaxID=3155075 RepID=UPI003430E359